MSKYDIYLQDNSNVLKNKLGITDEAALDTAESMMVRTRMALLYNSGFSDFSPIGVCKLHKILFGDVYEWAGKYREINIQKRESILAGKSVWYSNWDNIDKDLNSAWDKINAVGWKSLTHEDFANVAITSRIPIWMAIIFCPGQKEEKRNMIISKCSVFPAIEAIYDKQSIVC